jgi:membrane-anchored glycerophosphoryl diester phosphodiesterase (GDPDase)
MVMAMMDVGGKGYKSEWWSKKLRKKFFLWASYFIVGLYILILAVFIILSLFLPQTAADPAHIAFLTDFIFYFSSPVMLFAILLVLWSRELQ